MVGMKSVLGENELSKITSVEALKMNILASVSPYIDEVDIDSTGLESKLDSLILLTRIEETKRQQQMIDRFLTQTT